MDGLEDFFSDDEEEVALSPESLGSRAEEVDEPPKKELAPPDTYKR